MKKLAFFIVAGLMWVSAACGPVKEEGKWTKITGDDITLTGELDSPEISWSGGEAANLVVMDENYDVMWQIGTGDYLGKKFTPPVTYGEVPDGVNEQFSANSLESGVTYTVQVSLADGNSVSAEFVYR